MFGGFHYIIPLIFICLILKEDICSHEGRSPLKLVADVQLGLMDWTALHISSEELFCGLITDMAK